MAGGNMELARDGYAAFGRADFAWMIRHCTADVLIVQPPERPSAKTYRGRNEFRAAFTEWPSQWDAFELDLITPSWSNLSTSAVAKCIATKGEYVQSKSRVGSP